MKTHKNQIVWWQSGPGSIYISTLGGKEVPGEVEFKLTERKLFIERVRTLPFYFGDIGEVMDWIPVQWRGQPTEVQPGPLKVKLMGIRIKNHNGQFQHIVAEFLIMKKSEHDKLKEKLGLITKHDLECQEQT